MLEIQQEIMTPDETARWFRRSVSWLRQQSELVRLAGPHGQPLYHVRACRAYVLGRLSDLDGPALRQVQLRALASACGLGPQVTPASNSDATPIPVNQGP